MSAGAQPVHGRTQDQAVLGELLHSLSQPLTTLRCALELSVEQVAGQQDVVSTALEQTDRVIAVVTLMREYLDTESSTPSQTLVPLGPVLRGVIDQLTPRAAERHIRLQLTGGCNSTIALPEPRLRLALHYLIGILIEEQSPHRDITLRLEQFPFESELRAEGQREVSTAKAARCDPAIATLHAMQLAIARRLVESAGSSLVIGRDDQFGFLLRIPRPPRTMAAELSL